MSDIKIIYVLLHVIEFIMLFIAGRKISRTKTNKEYWKAAIWAFIPYFVVLGLRFGHSIDWNYYCERYYNIDLSGKYVSEPVFYGSFYILKSIGVPYFMVIALQVLFFIYSFLLFGKYFKDKLYYVLPLLPFMAQSLDNYIRWYFALSFVLISLYWLLSDKAVKNTKAIVFFILAVLTHNGVIVLLLFYLVYFMKNKFFSNKIAAVSVFISCFFLSISIMSFMADIGLALYAFIGVGENDNRLVSYLLVMDRITSEGLSDYSGVTVYLLQNQIMLFLSYLPVLIYGPALLKNYKYGWMVYDLFVICAFIYPFFSTVEIFDRYVKALMLFQAISSGIVYYKIIHGRWYATMKKALCIISFVCCIYPYSMQIIRNKKEYSMLYMWNADGKKLIDPILYLDDMKR